MTHITNVPYKSKNRERISIPDFSTDHTLTEALITMMEEYRDAIDTNRIRVIDTMEYASDAAAVLQWVASDAVATTGIAVTRNTSQYVVGASSVSFTTGTVGYAATVSVVKDLTRDAATYKEDRRCVGNHQNWKPYNFLGFYHYHFEPHSVIDILVIATDKNGNTLTWSLAAITANYDDLWGYTELAFDEATDSGVDYTNITSLTLKFDSGMGTSEALAIDQMILYKYGNGLGPVRGRMIPAVTLDDAVTRGEFVKISNTGGQLCYVDSIAEGDQEGIGIACDTASASWEDIMVQIDGLVLREVGESPASWEAGDYLMGSTGLMVKNASASDDNAICTYKTPVTGSVAQYSLAWVMLNTCGATPSA